LGVIDLSAVAFYFRRYFSHLNNRNDLALVGETRGLALWARMSSGVVWIINNFGVGTLGAYSPVLNRRIWTAEINGINGRCYTLSVESGAWRKLMEDAGLEVDWVGTAPMALLKMGRNLRDEGLGGSLRIMRNVVGDKELRARILQMRSVFTRYEKDMVGIAVVAHKP